MTTDPFPTDWHAWRAQWNEWSVAAVAAGHLRHTNRRHPGINMLADEKLGTWELADGRTVELSELTMPHGRDRVRFVGVTFAIGINAESALVESFTELAEVLHFRPEVTA